MKNSTINTGKICRLMAIALLLLSACKKDKLPTADTNVTNGITAVVSNNASSLSLFGYALNATHYNDTLVKPGPFTVLCPSNAAFINAGYASGVDIIKAAGLMNTLLPYYIIRKEVKFNSLPLAFGQPITASNGQTIYITHWQNSRDTAIIANGIRLSTYDKSAANGLVNITDGLLAPPVYKDVQEAVSGNANLTFFNAAIIHAGLTATLKSNTVYTLFAPVNTAFAAMGINSVADVYNTDPAVLKEFVNAHIVAGRNFVYDYILKADVTTNSYAETMLNGAKLAITLIPDNSLPGRFLGIQIQGASGNTTTISKPNVLAANGVVHSINSILTQ